ncbi:unnamed protein product [Parnassius apollo]|uniref:(apollo) hypothetical protein n=1 Tax=Parnassius apollo TaxID=110799 RepID=A0A8S3XZR7_PARAO|nr:unnamed protein product [Parnassius apollo]
MIKLGEGIIPKTLYGSRLGELNVQNQHRQIPGENQSAACQGKFIDNRLEYWYHNGINDGTSTFPNSVEQYSYLPAIIASAKIFYNATNSIGLIYEKSYTPKDGTFHLKNDAWRFMNYDYLKNRNPVHNIVLRTGEQVAVQHTAADPIKYELATVDNYLYNNYRDTPELHFIPPVGIGILPLLSNDGNHENSILNIMVEMGIEVETQSHGGNVLFTAMRNAQPNPTVMGYMTMNHQFAEPIVGDQPITPSTTQTLERQPEPTSVDVEIASRVRARRDDGGYDDTIIRQEQRLLQQETQRLERQLQYDERMHNDEIKAIKETTEKALQEIKKLEKQYKDMISHKPPPPKRQRETPQPPPPPPAAQPPRPPPPKSPEPERAFN